MMKNLRINKELYRDGLRQLRIVGIMGMVIYCLAAVLTAVGLYINSSHRYMEPVIAYGIGAITDAPVMAEGISLYDFHWILFTAFPVLIPVMTLILFNFLNQRNASDFYHAIPDTRGTLYVSYCAAIMTWLLAIIGVSTLLGIMAISLVPTYFVIWSTLPKSLFIIISACVLVMGGILIAKSLTGTFMSNLTVTAMILFLPRIFTTAITVIASEMLGFVVWDFSNSLMNSRYNVLMGIVMMIFGEANPLTSWSSGLYTLVLGLIYLAVAYVLFVRRKSESAGHAAISSRLQMVFRLAISLAVCLFPIYFIAANSVSNYKWSDDDLFLIVVFYVIAVVAYFIYELITTGKLRQFKKMFKGLILLAAGNLVILGILFGVYASVVNFRPAGEDIDHIRILSNDRNYFESQTDEIKISDDEVAGVTAKALERTIERHTGDGLTTEVAVDKEYYNKYMAEAQVRTVRKDVAIRCGLKTVYRELIYTEEEWNLVAEHLSEMEAFRDIFCTLPKIGDQGRCYSYHGWITNEQALKVLEVMKEEVREVDFAEWYVGVTDFYAKDYLDAICIYTEIPGTGNYRTVNLPILDSMVRTKECYLEQMSSESVTEEEKEVWETLVSALKEEKQEVLNYASAYVEVKILRNTREVVDDIYFNMECYDDGEDLITNYWGHLADKEQADRMYTLIEKLYSGEYGLKEPSEDMAIIIVKGTFDGKKGTYQSIDHSFCVSLAGEAEEEIEALLGYQLDSYLGKGEKQPANNGN